MTDGIKRNRQAERKVAEMIEKWWRRLEPGCEFHRALPGGVRPGENEKPATFRRCGCLVTTAKRWPFSVSVRRREVLRLDLFFRVQKRQRISPVWNWWRQAQTQASEDGMIAMMWLRKDQYRIGQPDFPWMVMLPRSVWWDKPKTLPNPSVKWGPADLWGCDIDFGTEPPVLWFVEQLLKTNPKRLMGI